MSRAEKRNQDYEIAYGKDHIMGLFIQVFDLKRANEDDEGLVIDTDQFQDKTLTVEKIVSIAEDYGFDLRDELNPDGNDT